MARELGCAESLLHRWKRDVLEANSDSEKEVITLRKKLREVEMERDILNKAALMSPTPKRWQEAFVEWIR